MVDCPADKVSVVLPVYNGARFLEDTLLGIERQEHANMEVIIIDDGSFDGSSLILERWASRAPARVKTLIRNPTNFGVCAALRLACAHAEGDYIAQIGQDDIWEADHLSSLVKTINSDPECVAAFALVKYINDFGEGIKQDIFKHSWINLFERDLLFARLLAGNFLCAPSSLFRKSSFLTKFLGVNNERLQDHELWLNLLTRGPFRTSERPTVYYRIHQSNLSAPDAQQLQSQYEFFSMQQRVFNSPFFYEMITELRTNEYRVAAFLDAVIEEILKVCTYYDPVKLNVLVMLDNLQERHEDDPVIAHARVKFSAAIGALSKGLLLSKSDRSITPALKPGAPMLVPVGEAAHGGVYSLLLQSGWFYDGRSVDVKGEGVKEFFFLVLEREASELLRYPQFGEAYEKRRVFVSRNQSGVTVEQLCIIPENPQLMGHTEISRMLRYIEDLQVAECRIEELC